MNPCFREIANYIRWRTRQDPLAVLKIPFEWTAVVYSHLRGRSAATKLPEVDAAWRSGTPADSPVHVLDFAAGFPPRLKEADDIISKALPDWNATFQDREDYFRLHRWGYGQTLARAWAHTKDEKYPRYWISLWSDWIQKNPASQPSLQWESYSVAERIVNWCVSLSLMHDAPQFDAAAVQRIRESLIQHARRLSSHLEVKDAHNHLINDARALFVFAAMWGHKALETAGWDILERELGRQVLCDGMLGEQSVHYHLLLTRTYFEAALVAKSVGRDVSPEFLMRVQKMVSVALAFLREDGSIPTIGDVSPDCDTASLAGVIGAAAKYFNIPGDASPPSVHFQDSGFWILKKERLHLVAHADPRGEVIRHGHDDALGIVLWFDGDEILIDAGNPTYTAGPEQDFFRSAAAHNTVSVDEFELSPVNPVLKLFLRKDYFARPVEMSHPQTDQSGTHVRITHHGFGRLMPPVVLTRTITATSKHVSISDRLEGAGRHTLRASWHFGSQAISRVSAGHLRLSHGNGRQFDAVWLHNGQPMEVNIIEGRRSFEYGQRQPSAAASVSMRFESSCKMDFQLRLV